jgi:MFS family permease
MNKYFSNKDYRMLYYDSFFKTFANGIYSVFTPVILYKSGVSVTMIIFIYMIQFLIMGLFTPLAGTLSKKIGVANTKLLSYILKGISMLLVLNAETNMIHYLEIAIIYGFSGAANNPLNTYIPSKIVKEDFRGRFNSFTYILRCFSSIVRYIFAGTFLIKDNNLIIVISVFISYIIAYFALMNLDKSNLSYDIKSSFKESYKYLLNKNENKELKRVSGLRSFIILERLIAVPLYLYISIMDLKTFTSLYVISTIIELFSLFISGNTFDKNKLKTFNIISVIKGIVTAIFLFFKNIYILMINQSLYKLVDNVYDSSYSALSQSKVAKDKQDTMLLSMIHEMSLCFYEFIVLLVLLIISIISVDLTFKIMFIGSIFILIINAKLVEKWNYN